jgi:hypothetical protein
MLWKKKWDKAQTKLNFNPLGRPPTKSVEKLHDDSLNFLQSILKTFFSSSLKNNDRLSDPNTSSWKFLHVEVRTK